MCEVPQGDAVEGPGFEGELLRFLQQLVHVVDGQVGQAQVLEIMVAKLDFGPAGRVVPETS